MMISCTDFVSVASNVVQGSGGLAIMITGSNALTTVACKKLPATNAWVSFALAANRMMGSLLIPLFVIRARDFTATDVLRLTLAAAVETKFVNIAED